jgi:hypothetical protein
MHVVMLFLDGVGVGLTDPRINPFFAASLPTLRSLLGGSIPSLAKPRVSSSALLIPLDATLGVAGLPQSGTGQTALFTGLNGAKLIGKHFGPYPYSSLKPIIEEHNLFKRILACGLRPYFANAFPQRFFDYAAAHKSRLTVTTLSCMMSNVPLCRAEQLEQGKALSADITNAGWPELGYARIRQVDPAAAGKRLAALAEQYDFVLFEYWKTDKAGHSCNMEEAIDVLECFDQMMGGLLAGVDLSKTCIVLTSDHGNIEDLGTKGHTRNPVPLMVTTTSRSLLKKLPPNPDLTCVLPILLHLLRVERK